jgi:hypothetical protein
VAISDGLLYSYRVCADGWPSHSIGIQGACSHHGGVVTRKVDKRTDTQRYACYALNGAGIVGLLAALILGFGPLSPAQFHGFKLFWLRSDKGSDNCRVTPLPPNAYRANAPYETQGRLGRRRMRTTITATINAVASQTGQ